MTQKINGHLFLIIAILLSAPIKGWTQKRDYTKFVNLFIGTYKDGQTFPGAAFPFGSVQLSPDTRKEGLLSCGGYYYPDSMILGFSHTHLSGVGEPEYRDVLFMPTVGKIQLQSGREGVRRSGYQSSYDHKEEKAIPGYYAVTLKDYHIHAELTATQRVGFHRYTFPKSDSSNVIIDLAHPNGAKNLIITKVNDHEVEGLRRSHGWAWDQYVYFVAQFSKPFNSFKIAKDDQLQGGLTTAEGKNIKGVVTFATGNSEQILIKVGISAVSCEGARKNLETEIPGWNFDETAMLTGKAWNKELSRIEVENGRKEDIIQFYTSMYRLCISPNLFMDIDGRYRGVDHQVHQANGFNHYTVFSLWDTFRAFHPLFTLIDQKRTTDFINTLLQAYQDGGRLPMWPLAGNYTDDMLGYHAVPVIADAYMKGIRGFDTIKAFEAMKHSAELDKLGLKYYKKIGYLPYNHQGESVSKTLEYCYDDWCISQVAKKLGREEDYLNFHQRAHHYENVFDASTGFMRGKSTERNWLTPFDPKVNSAYSEGNAYQYMFVPHDVDGLMNLMGGDKKMALWLDSLFFMPSKEPLKIGEYWHGNEPGHHLPYLYDYAGEPWKSQYLTHKILTELYRNENDGLAGNEDCGQMSAWYILSALGFYPVSPGQALYAIGSPLFGKAVVHLENGKSIVIRSQNNSSRNFYIQSAKLNGKVYPNSYLRHEDLMKGAELTFSMGSTPNKNWAQKRENRPFSENGMAVTLLPYVRSGKTLFTDSTLISLACDTEGAEIYYTLNGATPDKAAIRYMDPFSLDRNTTLKMMAFHPQKMNSTMVEIDFQKASLQDAKLATDLADGLNYDYFENFFVQSTDMELVKPVSTGKTKNFNIAMAKVPNYFGLWFKGFVKIPVDGIYTFHLSSNDGSHLYLDGKELIENDGNHAMVEESGSIGLKSGFHAIEVKYMQCGGGKGLKVDWEGPGIAKSELPASALFRME